jgi:hypothetical protein
MDLPTRIAVKEAFQKAPAYVRDFIKSSELAQVFGELRAKYTLHIDDAGVFADILNAVILELIPLGSFESALAEHIQNLKQEGRTKLTREVNEKVFAVIRSRASAPAPSKVEGPTPPPPPPPKTTEDTVSAAIQLAQTSAAPTTSVVTQKLSAPMTETPKEVSVSMPTVPAPNKPAENPRYSGGADPYREPIS